MLLVRGAVGGTALTGTIYEEGEDPPSFSGSPDDGSPYVWICDAFYEVDTGGSTQEIGGEEIQIAFESPMPQGFNDRDQALDAAKDHVRTQFVRIGVAADEVEISVRESEPEESE